MLELSTADSHGPDQLVALVDEALDLYNVLEETVSDCTGKHDVTPGQRAWPVEALTRICVPCTTLSS